MDPAALITALTQMFSVGGVPLAVLGLVAWSWLQDRRDLAAGATAHHPRMPPPALGKTLTDRGCFPMIAHGPPHPLFAPVHGSRIPPPPGHFQPSSVCKISRGEPP